MPLGDRFSAVLEAAGLGEPWALEELYRDLHPSVLGYLRGQAAREAEDLASEVFIDMARGIRTFKGAEPAFRSWVFTIAHHRLVDHRRASRRRDSGMALLRAVPPKKGDTETDAMESLDTGSALGRIAKLPPDQAEVVLLRVVADLPVDQVARIVRKRPGAVRALQLRALRRLARDLAGAVTR
jgi:RNA polymerase sigma-70 factor, ECF subfamily